MMKHEQQHDMMRPRSIIERLNAEGSAVLLNIPYTSCLKRELFPLENPVDVTLSAMQT